MNDNIIVKDQSYKTLILSGGGIRGISFLGALKYFKDRGNLEHLNTFIGTSIGSIIATFLCLEYPIEDLFQFMLDLNIDSVTNFQISKLIQQFGLDSGNTLIFVIKQLLVKCGYDENITFKNLQKITGKTLIITATNVNKRCIKYFNHNDTPNLRIVDAIRMSISIPFLYTAPLYGGDFYVDGGVLDNFPLHLANGTHPNEVLAINLGYGETKDKNICTKNDIKNLEDFSINLINTLLCEIEELRNKDCTIKPTLTIKTERYSTFDFNLETNEKIELFRIGYTTAKEFGESYELKTESNCETDSTFSSEIFDQL
jgi:NTE family protein